MGSGIDLKQDGIEFPGAQVFGHSANMVDIEDKTIESGRYISDDEVQRSALGGSGRRYPRKVFPQPGSDRKDAQGARPADARCRGRREARIVLWRLDGPSFIFP